MISGIPDGARGAFFTQSGSLTQYDHRKRAIWRGRRAGVPAQDLTNAGKTVCGSKVSDMIPVLRLQRTIRFSPTVRRTARRGDKAAVSGPENTVFSKAIFMNRPKGHL